MKLIFGRDDEVAQWVAEHGGGIICPPYVAIGAAKDDDTLCGGAVFNGWNGANIDISLASDGGLTRGTIRGIYHYVFEQSKATRATAYTKRSNKVMRNMLPNLLGFQFEAVLHRYYGPEKKDDAFVFVLFPEQARQF